MVLLSYVSINNISYTYICVYTYTLSATENYKHKISHSLKKKLDLLVLLAEHLLDRHTGEELETGYFL